MQFRLERPTKRRRLQLPRESPQAPPPSAGVTTAPRDTTAVESPRAPSHEGREHWQLEEELAYRRAYIQHQLALKSPDEPHLRPKAGLLSASDISPCLVVSLQKDHFTLGNADQALPGKHLYSRENLPFLQGIDERRLLMSAEIAGSIPSEYWCQGGVMVEVRLSFNHYLMTAVPRFETPERVTACARLR